MDGSKGGRKEGRGGREEGEMEEDGRGRYQ